VDYIKTLGLKKKDEAKLITLIYLFDKLIKESINNEPFKNKFFQRLSSQTYQTILTELNRLVRQNQITLEEKADIIVMVNKL